MTTSDHAHGAGRKAALALGGLAVIPALAVTADLAARTSGTLAGVVLVSALFAACWVVHRVRPALHPRRPASRCEPAAPAATWPTRIAA